MLWSEVMLMMAALRNQDRVLRETPNFVACATANGVRITTKDHSVTPRSRTIALQMWKRLSPMSDAEFDGSCVLDLGIGIFEAPGRRKSPGSIN